MKKRTFALRIDLESDKGIKKGVPKILKLLKKHKIKASFYVVMGGEANFFDFLRYRKAIPGERKIKAFSTIEKIRILLFPRDFVKKNKKILKEIIDDGHELGIHGWKHRSWLRGFDKIDIRKHLVLAKNKYIKIFGKEPLSFAAPGFKTDKKVIKILEELGFKVISDLPGNKPKKIKNKNIINIPITIKGKNNTPIIEYLTSKNLKDEKILEKLKEKIKKKKLSIIYVHGLFESIKKIDLLEDLFKYIKKNKIKNESLFNIGN